MIAVKGYEKFLLTPLDELLKDNDGTIRPARVESKLHGLGKAAQSLKLYRKETEFLTKQQILEFDLKERSRNGNISALEMIHCSSGSSSASGPTFWGRDTCEELAVSVRFEQIFRDNFEAHKKSTLAVNCFPMGSWVGGVFTAFCTRSLSQKEYLISQITPGNNPDEILRISSLFSLFDQVVLMGYPPFVKMIIDKGNTVSAEYWKPYHLKFVFAGEVFSEEWRSLLAARSHVDDLEKDIVSMYGTADAGVLATETVLSVKLRRFFASNPGISKSFFKLDRIPSLMQYDPLTRYLEIKQDDNTLAVSALPWTLMGETDEEAAKRLALPLEKYAIGDNGGIINFEDMIKFVNLNKEVDPISVHSIMDLIESGSRYRVLPFVWVFGRKFWTVSLYGANVFVENVMAGLEQPEISEFVTSKFVLSVSGDPDDCRLLIRIELVTSNIPEKFKETCGLVIKDQITRLNSEYKNYVPEQKQIPEIVLHSTGDLPYFKTGVKHQYISH